MPNWFKKTANTILSPFDLMVVSRHNRLMRNPSPWYTKGAIAWLEDRVDQNMIVLEYGGGRSSLWWAKKAKKVHTVEGSAKWCVILLNNFSKHPELLKKWRLHMSPCPWTFTDNAEERFWKLHGLRLSDSDVQCIERDYVSRIEDKFDVIVIDGSTRIKNMKSVRALLDDTNIAFVVIDNTNNEIIEREVDGITPGTFKRLDFPATEEDDTSWNREVKWMTSILVNEKQG